MNITSLEESGDLQLHPWTGDDDDAVMDNQCDNFDIPWAMGICYNI